MLFGVGRVVRKPQKKQHLTSIAKKKRILWPKKYKKWRLEDWNKVLFSDEKHFDVIRSQYVRRSIGASVREDHIEQKLKHAPKKMFWGNFCAVELEKL